jgi:Cupin domain
MEATPSPLATRRFIEPHPPACAADPGSRCQCHHNRATGRGLIALRFLVDGTTRRLGPGETITIPAGVPHRFANEGDEDAVAIQELRPALRTAEFFQTYFELATRGELDHHGKPSLLRSALLGPKFAAEIRLASPPWPIQRTAYALLAPIARLRGYTPST